MKLLAGIANGARVDGGTLDHLCLAKTPSGAEIAEFHRFFADRQFTLILQM